MGEYLSPGVYAESVNNANMPIEAVSASTGGFVGITVRGILGVPTLVTSWQNFLDTFAYGMETPFLVNSDLAYSVYGFFQNGGTRCYIIRAAHSTAAKAEGELKESSTTKATLSAKDEGTWGNKLKVSVAANADVAANFDLTVKYDGEIVEKFENLSNTASDDNYWLDAIVNSKFISCDTGTLVATSTDVAFTDGADGISDITDTDFTNALELFDSVDDVNLICVPGQVSSAMTTAILSYAENRGNVFAIIDGAKSADVSAISTFRKSLSCKNGALYYPWIKVTDPISKTGKLRDCPVCGHVMGVYARTIQERGVWKAPAGTEAVVRGAIEVVHLLVKADCDILNPIGVNAIMPRANVGITVWGARSMNPDNSMRYVSDVLLETNIKESIKQGTQWAVFEPNNALLWLRVKTSIESFLDNLWRDGGLFGSQADEAYFVKCDEELNPQSVRDAGKLICEVGYAPNKPAEFIIIRIAHSISND